MLFFEGNKIIFNEEVGKKANYNLTEFPFADNSKLTEFLPNCKLYKKKFASEIKNSGQVFGMDSKKQFLSFITSWIISSARQGLELEEEEAWSWIRSYYTSIMKFHRIFGEHTSDELFFPELQIHRPKMEDWKSIKLKDSPIQVNYPVTPEISWLIVNCWRELAKGNKGPFFKEEVVNDYIQDNIRRIQDRMEKENFFGPKLFTANLSLTENIHVKNINYQNPYSFYYFYCPVCDEAVRTNYLYLQNKWAQYHNLIK